MGLFGSRKITQVGTAVTRVIEDDALPNSIITGSWKAILESDGQMIEHTMEELGVSLGIRMHQYYRYGRDTYVHGLPSGTSFASLEGRETIKQAIEAQVGAAVGLDYYKVGPVNLLHVGWQTLVESYGYDSNTNKMTVAGQVRYLEDMQVVVTNATLGELNNGSLDQWGLPANGGFTPDKEYLGALRQLNKPSPFIVDSTATADHVLVKYCWEEDGTKTVSGVVIKAKVLKHGTFTIPITGIVEDADYHQARYFLNGKAHYWTYQVGSNTNAAVENVFATTQSPDGTFFPFVYFRYNKASTKNTADAAHYKKLMKYINMEFDDVVDAINENPDIADVEQAMLMVAVPANTTNPIEQRYLYDFFLNLWTAADLKGTTTRSEKSRSLLGLLSGEPSANTIVIQDNKFKMALSWAGIQKRRVAGTIGPIGSYSSGETFNDVVVEGADQNGTTVAFNSSVPVHFYRYQIGDNTYDEVRVQGLKMTYHIFEQYTATGDEESDILMVPVDYEITRQYTIPEREKLYSRALHYIFNSRVTTKLKWYQTKLFKAILIIIAIVVTVITLGKTWQSIVAAFSISLGAGLLFVLTMVLKYVAIRYAFRKVVKSIGAEAALILATIAMAAGMYQGFNSASGFAEAPWATDLLAISSNLSQAANRQIVDDYKALENDYRSFKEFVEEKNEEIEKVEALMKNDIHLVPMVIFGEKPDDFYQRTVHSGNIGVVGIEAISSYVDVALRLPKLSETLGEIV